MYNHIEVEFQGVQKALQSRCAVSTMPLIVGIVEAGDEATQFHQITDKVEAHLRKYQEETTQSIQALTQVQGVPVERHSSLKRENISLQAQWDKEKAEKGEVDRRAARSKGTGQ
jgi:hypothetical protein